ncbi:hypothetical protein OJF2_58590 [Aquisphaera giovannonii]|uniref:Uncharacterized protein n=1 Tax=Aquisphaera giovannonii TaxID=406548 RepID=A0A5B9W9K8_9BACT|nr:hypothetical protein [Aquisphaera giovannonii]QEH37272.1 hypothetical protein OJF2_58590 [Aquisphaera giovannonii]
MSNLVAQQRTGAQSWHGRVSILLGLVLIFSTWAFLAVRTGSPSDVREWGVVRTIAATVAGPFAGAVARHFQPCCLASSMAIAAFFVPFLAIGLLAQVVPWTAAIGSRWAARKIVFWTLGWTIWLFGGPASFLHAFC